MTSQPPAKKFNWKEMFPYRQAPDMAKIDAKWGKTLGSQNPLFTNYGDQYARWNAPAYHMQGAEYKPTSYWEEPRRVARYHDIMQALGPTGWQPPEWLDQGAIDAAYEYYKLRNNGAPWQDWKHLPEDDPGREFLASIPNPPQEMWWPGESVGATQLPPEYFQQPDQYEPLPPEQIGSPEHWGMTDEEWNALEPFQRNVIWTMQNPEVSGGLTGLVASGGKPGAALLGIGIGHLSKPLLDEQGNAVIDPATGKPEYKYGPLVGGAAQGAMVAFNALALLIERTAGTVSQAWGSLIKPEEYGSFKELFANPEAAWYAASMSYEAGLMMKGSDPRKPWSYIPALMPFTGTTIDPANTLALGQILPGGADVPELAKEGEVWGWTSPTPYKPEVGTGLDAVVAARRLMTDQGLSPEETYQYISNQMGITGFLREMMGSIIIDPLNVMGEVQNAIILKPIAKVTGNVPLLEAARSTDSPIQALRTYWQEQRLKPPEQTASMGPVSRYLAGLDVEGKWRVLEKPQEKPGLLGRVAGNIFGQTPKSRATEIINTSALFLQEVLNRAGDDVPTMIKYIKTLKNNPHLAAAELSMAALGSPEAAAIPKFLQDFDPILNERGVRWEATRPLATMLDNIAAVTGKTSEAVLLELSNTKDTATLLRQLVEVAQQTDTPQARAIIEAYEQAGRPASTLPRSQWLTPEKLQEIGKVFGGENPAPRTAVEFQAQLFGDMMKAADDWAVRWFDIKPDPLWARLGGAVKAAQSLALLSLNPTYLLNNVINNAVTMAVEGVFGMRSTENMVATWKRIGIEPPRLRSGFGPAASGVDLDYAGLRSASDAKDAVSKMTGVINAVNDKVGLATKASARMEQAHSAQAWTAGYLQYWRRTWRRGRGFTRMQPDLEQAINQVHPQAAEMVYRLIEGGMNQKELEAALWEGVGRRTVEGSLNDALARMKRAGMDISEADARDMLTNTGILDSLNEALRDAQDVAGRRAAFRQVEQKLNDWIDKMAVDALKRKVTKVAYQAEVEGIAGVVRLYDDWVLNTAEMAHRNAVEWTNTWDAIARDDTYKTQLIEAQKIRSRTEYDRYWKSTEASLLGIIEGLKLDTPEARSTITRQIEIADNWREFFKLRDELYDKFFNTQYETRELRQAAWEGLLDDVEKLYDKHSLAELGLQNQMDEAFALSIEGKFGAERAAAVRSWREKMRIYRQEIFGRMARHRAEMRNATKEERDAAWVKFYNEEWLPLLRNKAQADIEGAHAVAGQGPGPDVPEARVEPPPTQPPAEPPPDVRAIASEYGIPTANEAGQKIPGSDAKLVNIVKKYGGDEAKVYKRVEDIRPDVAERALEAWRAAKEKYDRLKELPVGAKTSALGVDAQTSYNFQYRIVELQDLVTSHLDTFEVNELYPRELQPRQRERAASQMQIDRIAMSLNPDALLTDTHRLDSGAMIIGPDIVVESGNGRAMALRRAASLYPERYQEYVDVLRSRLGEYGFTEEQISGYKQPVLVRERLTDIDRVKFAAEANQSAAARMSGVEVAIQDAGLITDALFGRLEIGEGQTVKEVVYNRNNFDLVRSLFSKLPDTERAVMMDADGQLNQVGIERLSNALFVKTFPGEAGMRLFALLTETADANIKLVKDALYGALTDLLRIEKLTSSGQREKSLSLAPDLAVAMDTLLRLRQRGMSVDDFLASQSFLTPAPSPFQQSLLRFLQANGRSPNRIREAVRNYAGLVEKQPLPGQAGMFGDEATLPRETLWSTATEKLTGKARALATKAAEGETAGAVDMKILEYEERIKNLEAEAARERAARAEERKQHQMELQAEKQKRGIDELTGLKKYTKGRQGAFDAEVDNAPWKAVVDLAGLKWINDTFGHAAGNEFIFALVEAAKQSEVELYRMGGDEFIAPFGDEAGAKAAIERLKKAVAETIIVVEGEDGQRYAVTGFSIHAGDGADFAAADAGARTDIAPGYERGKQPPGVEVRRNLGEEVQGDSGAAARDALTRSGEVEAGPLRIQELETEPTPAEVEADAEAPYRQSIEEVEAIRARQAEMEADIEGTRLLSAGDYREMLRRGAIETWKLDPQEVDDALAVVDARARAWARAYGKTEAEYYESRFGGVVQGGVGELYQDTSPIWYSRLERVVEAFPQDKMTAEQLKAAVTKGGVKQDELFWTGFDDWLEGKKGQKVTKQEAIEFLQQNRVEVEEIVKSDRPVFRYESVQEYEDAIQRFEQRGMFEVAEELTREMEELGVEREPTRYAEHALPGGVNYRELLFKLPELTRTPQPERLTELPEGYVIGVDSHQPPERRYHILPPGQGHARPFEGSHPTEEAAIVAALERINFDRLQAWKTSQDVYRSPHWAEPNVLAHVRFNDRVDADGKRVLFVEEVQSDWHQAGREKGYKGQLTELPAEYEVRDWQGVTFDRYVVVKKSDPQHYGISEIASGKTIEEAIEKALLALDEGVPPAPFAKTWPELVMKRMLRWAAENGYDRVAWTTGEQQAARYDLAKQVDHITTTKLDDGNYQVTAIAKDKSYAVLDERMPASKLPDVIGKELADKVVASDKTLNVWEGSDLKVGGAGMRTFYDQMLPRMMEKYGKKWGVKVREGKIEVSRQGTTAITEPVHSLDITPEMRASIMEGQPLFQGPKGAVSFTDEGKAIFHALNSPDISTFIHEVGHVFRRDLEGADLDTVATYGGLTGGQEFIALEPIHGEYTYLRQLKNRTAEETARMREIEPEAKRYQDAEEKFARAFERYIAEGTAPIPELTSVFERLKRWMLRIYTAIVGSAIDVEITPELRDVFDRLLGAEAQRTPEAEVPRPTMPTGQLEILPTGDDLPLMSGTPMRGSESVFRPRETPRQGTLIDMRPQDMVEGRPVEGGTAEGAGPMFGDRRITVVAEHIEKARTLRKQGELRYGDTYKDAGIKKVIKGFDRRGEEIWGYPYSPDTFIISDASGMPIRHYITLENGARVHPDELDRVIVDKAGRVTLDAEKFSVWTDSKKNKATVNSFARAVSWASSWMKGVDTVTIKSKSGYEVTLPLKEWKRLTGVMGIVKYKKGKAVAKITFSEFIDRYADKYGEAIKIPEQPPTEPGSWFSTDTGPKRTLFQNDTRILYQDGDGTVQSLNNDGTPPEPVGRLGAADELDTDPPVADIAAEGWSNILRPLYKALEEEMVPDAQAIPDGIYGLGPVDAATMRRLRGYIEQVKGEMSQTKLGALRYGEMKRDSSLLNYSKRYGFDNVLQMIFPYQFWYTRSALNWALRAIDKPGYIAAWAKLRELQERTLNSPGFPTRLKNKMRIPFPFLPDWMGDGVYIDPLRQLFPFEQFMKPFQRMAQDKSTITRRAEFILTGWAEEETVSKADALQAVETQAGPLWDKAFTQARMEIESEISNPFEFIDTMIGASLPVDWAYQYLKGEPEEIGQLPVSRLVTSVTALLGANKGRGWNPEGPIRRALGLPEFGEFGDYQIDVILSNMTADGECLPEEAVEAMINRSGPLFEEAQRRAQQTRTLKMVGGFLSADIFPTGEQWQRGIKEEYERAIESWKEGDEGQLQKFYDAYPEYEARSALFKEPEERLRSFLIGAVWDRYMSLPDLTRRQVTESFGELFEQAFLEKETRSYDVIDNETLAYWAQAMGGRAPEQFGELPEAASLELASPEITQQYQDYVDDKKRLFPGIGGKLSIYYNIPAGPARDAYSQAHPEIEEYLYWHDQALANNPEIIPYAISEENKVYGARPEVQALYYQYNAERARRYPDAYALQDTYYSLPPGGERRAFLDANPQLESYWDWRRSFMAKHPEMIPYLYSVEGLAGKVLGETYDATRAAEEQVIDVFSEMDPLTMSLFNSWAYTGGSLSPAMRVELRKLWELYGSPGEFDSWVDGLRWQLTQAQ